MKAIEQVIARFNSLLSATDLVGQVVRENRNNEEFVGVSFVSDHGAANASLWARESLGGLLRSLLVDGAGDQRMWRHLERPTPAQVEDTWNEMLSIYRVLGQNAAER